MNPCKKDYKALQIVATFLPAFINGNMDHEESASKRRVHTQYLEIVADVKGSVMCPT